MLTPRLLIIHPITRRVSSATHGHLNHGMYIRLCIGTQQLYLAFFSPHFQIAAASVVCVLSVRIISGFINQLPLSHSPPLKKCPPLLGFPAILIWPRRDLCVLTLLSGLQSILDSPNRLGLGGVPFSAIGFPNFSKKNPASVLLRVVLCGHWSER